MYWRWLFWEKAVPNICYHPWRYIGGFSWIYVCFKNCIVATLMGLCCFSDKARVAMGSLAVCSVRSGCACIRHLQNRWSKLEIIISSAFKPASSYQMLSVWCEKCFFGWKFKLDRYHPIHTTTSHVIPNRNIMDYILSLSSRQPSMVLVDFRGREKLVNGQLNIFPCNVTPL